MPEAFLLIVARAILFETSSSVKLGTWPKSSVILDDIQQQQLPMVATWKYESEMMD